MKYRLLLLLPLLMGVSSRADEPKKASQSPDLKAAREAYQKDKAKAAKAADEWYVQRLRKLKAAADGRNFELATTIGEEIRQLDFPTMLTTKKWRWTRGHPSTVTFMENGEVIHSGFKGRWVVISPWSVVLLLPDGRVASLIYDPAKDHFSCRDFDGSKDLTLEEEP